MRIPASLFSDDAFDNSINDIFQQKAAMSLGLPEYAGMHAILYTARHLRNKKQTAPHSPSTQ